MADATDLTIIVCTRNRADTLAGTLESLTRLTRNNSWEALLVDNASTDDTALLLAKTDDLGGRLRLMKVDRIGLGAARDAAWRAARGHIITFTDDDCYLEPTFVDELVDAFRRRPGTDLIGGRILLFDPSDVHHTIDERDFAVDIEPYTFVPAGALHGANLSFRRAALERIGGIDPEFGAGTQFPSEDIDAVAATIWAGMRAGFDPAPLVYHHHRRKEADLPKLVEGYDKGRGAYYAKYLMRPDTRVAYFRGWMAINLAYKGRSGFVTIRRELASARRYIISRRRYGFLVGAATVAGICYLGLTLRLALCKAGRLIGLNKH
jgi:glycosyltransferase involved in cell wall biosynthesis